MNARNKKRLTVLALAPVVFLFFCHCSFDNYGAKVIIRNADAVPLHSVVVRVTGNSYSLGELAVAETRTIKTYPTGESHIVVEHINASGEKRESSVDCYFEPGYRRTINVKVTANSATRSDY